MALLQSVPGVGPVTIAMLIARLPELGRLSAREAGALVGVVPYTRQSGKWHGESHIFGGRADLRSTLFMAAHNAVRCARDRCATSTCACAQPANNIRWL